MFSRRIGLGGGGRRAEGVGVYGDTLVCRTRSCILLLPTTFSRVSVGSFVGCVSWWGVPGGGDDLDILEHVLLDVMMGALDERCIILDNPADEAASVVHDVAHGTRGEARVADHRKPQHWMIRCLQHTTTTHTR